MRILYVIACLEEGGGIAEVVRRLSAEMTQIGNSVVLATVTRQASALASVPLAKGVQLAAFPASRPSSLYFSRKMLFGLRAFARQADVVHVHGNWTFPVWWACRCAKKENKRLVLSPHGSLDPVRLSHSAVKKHFAGWMGDRRCLAAADVLLATSEKEKGWIDAYLGNACRKPIAVIPNGVELPCGFAAARVPTGADRVRRVVYLGRMHPLKGLDWLLEAWGRFQPQGWELVIGGGTEAELLALLGKDFLPQGVHCAGIITDETKAAFFAAADLLVLPTRSENFGLAVAEALACGIPAVTTRAAPWQELEESHCGWWTEPSERGIESALREALSLTDEERRAMGLRGKGLVSARYRWPAVAHAFLRLYQ